MNKLLTIRDGHVTQPFHRRLSPWDARVQTVRTRESTSKSQPRWWLAGAALLLIGSVLGVAAVAAGQGDDDALAAVVALVDGGHFVEAEQRIEAALAAADTPAEQRSALQFERERMRRILLDSPSAPSKSKRRAQTDPGPERRRIRALGRGRLFERQNIDGKILYFNRSPSNLFRLSTEALGRRQQQSAQRRTDGNPNAHHREVRDAALAQQRNHVAPRRIRVRKR